MTDELSETTARRNGNNLTAVIAWVTVLAVVGCIISLQMNRRAEPKPVGGSNSLEYVMLGVQSKYIVGVANWFGPAATTQLEKELRAWPTETPGQAVRAAIVIGEVIGPEEALERIRKLKETQASDADSDTPAEFSDETLEALELAYEDYVDGDPTAASLSTERRESVRNDLGWFGELALTPDGTDAAARNRIVAPAKRVVFGILSFTVLWGGLMLVGIGVLLFTILRVALRSNKRFDSQPRNGRLYLEAFAIWIVSFVLLGFVIGFVIPANLGMLGSLAVMLLSLGAVTWPRFRGVSWNEIQADIGWTRGQGLLRELVAGVGSYATALPMIAGAYIVVFIVLYAFGIELQFDHSSAHPIVEQQIGASIWTAIQMFILACIMAPLLEETVFRGLLYRHLREASSRLPFLLSMFFSAVVNATIFAAIHPQGFVALPALGAIAVALSLSREYRDSLIAPIIGHAINNTVTMSLLFFLFSN
ncbi:MAG: type II CAAX endopeptidase family protein [Planctomycetota bacterium]